MKQGTGTPGCDPATTSIQPPIAMLPKIGDAMRLCIAIVRPAVGWDDHDAHDGRGLSLVTMRFSHPRVCEVSGLTDPTMVISPGRRDQS